MCPTCPPFSLGVRSSRRSLVPATRPPAENGKAEQEEDANKGKKRPATRALSLKKKEEEEEEDDDDDDDDVDSSPDTKRRKPKTPPARKVGNVRKKAPDKKCVFAGHGTYKCRARTTTARATRTVPALDHVPEDVRKQRCCKTCYTYWRYLHEPCVFARHGTYKCRARGTTTARATQRVPALDHVPDNISGQRCCVPCYNYWKDIQALQNNEFCTECSKFGRRRGGGFPVHVNNMIIKMCSTCSTRTHKIMSRLRKGIQPRRRGRKDKGDW